jgi:hypothetical protein
MGTHEEFAILRRFKTLNYQNLLYLQAEIIHLEQELEKLVNRDMAHLERGDFTKDWWTLAHANGEQAQQQWKKVLKIRKKLKKYSKSVLLFGIRLSSDSVFKTMLFSSKPLLLILRIPTRGT